MVGLTSCEKPVEKPEPSRLDNEYSYNGEVSKIGSVVYEENASGIFEFYVSPSSDVVDVEGMLAANDFIKIVSNTVSGDVDFSAAGNQVKYENIDLNSETMADAKEKSLKITLISADKVEIACKIEMATSDVLEILYSGACIKEDDLPADDSVELDRIILQYYMGQASDILHNYYLIFSNADFVEDGNVISLRDEGYLFMIDLYVAQEGDLYTLPEGEYESTDADPSESFTFYTKYTSLTHTDELGTVKNLKIESPITVSGSGDDYVISATFEDLDGSLRTISYSGALNIEDVPNTPDKPVLPQIGHDVKVEGYECYATYYGNMLQSATGMMQITILDKTYAEEEGAGGYGMVIMLFHDLFANSKEAKLMPGEYSPNSSFKWQTWMPTVEVPMDGLVFPMGTYAQCDDGTNMGQFSYGKEGIVKISESDNGYTIEFDLVSRDGHSIKGSYTGAVEVVDESDDNDTDDGTSSLVRDYDMDLTWIDTARIYTPSEIYVQGIGYRPVADYGCGLQIIDIGSPSGKDGNEGDIFRLEICVEPGKENEITPGEYLVGAERWPQYFVPGAAVKGIVLAHEGFVGTRWMHFYESGGYPYMDEHALFYGGSVKISKAEEEGNYTFEIDGTCVRKHHIRGTWTGPIKNGWTGEVLPVSPWRPSYDNKLPGVSPEKLVNYFSPAGFVKTKRSFE